MYYFKDFNEAQKHWTPKSLESTKNNFLNQIHDNQQISKYRAIQNQLNQFINRYYGKKASEDDKKLWENFLKQLANGLTNVNDEVEVKGNF